MRGVPGVWYCCDMMRRMGKEGKGGSTRLEPKLGKVMFRREGCVDKTEWSGWFGCSRLAIVTFPLRHCQRACCVDALDMAIYAKTLCKRDFVQLDTP